MKNFIKGISLILLSFFVISCQNDDNVIFIPIDNSSDEIVLSELKIDGDSVKLEWTMLDTSNFAGYLIIRKDEKDLIVDPNIYNPYEIVRIYDPNITSYVDVDVPLEKYLEYQVIGLLRGDNTTDYIHSNSRLYERPGLNIFEIGFTDVLPDLDNNRFYFIEKEEGEISIFNYETSIVEKTIKTNATIGFSSLGSYNGVKELYVPRSDGWVFIYNAETLEKIDQIDIGHPSSCVVNNNGLLFVSTDAWTNRPLKVFSRSQKTLISEGGDFEDTRLRIIPNSSTEIIEVTINIGPTDLDYYGFDANGNYIAHNNDRYHGDHPLNASIFQFFPNGEKFITSSEGAIYDTDLNYVNRIPRGNYEFSDYAFNSNASAIFCSSSNTKAIVTYSSSDFIEQEIYATQGYPMKIYRKDNVLICISSTREVSGYYGYNNINEWMIEKIEIID